MTNRKTIDFAKAGLLAASIAAGAMAQAAALRYVYDMPLAEIAATLGTSEGTVKQHLSRARHTLASTLGATTQEEEQ